MSTSSPFLFSILCSLFLGVSLVLCQLFLAISLTHKLYFSASSAFNQSPVSFTNKALQVSAISAYIFVSCAGLSIVIPRVCYLLFHMSAQHNGFVTFHSLYLVFMALAYVSAYFFMVTRLYTTFKGSCYAVNLCIIKVHICVAIATVLLGFASILMVYIGFDVFVMNALFSIMLVSTMAALVYLVYQFNHRLFSLVLLLNTQSQMDITNPQDAMSLSQRQLRLLRVVRRQTLLGVCIVSLAFVAIGAYMVAVGVTDGEYVTLSTYPLSQGYIAIFDSLNVFTLNVASLTVYLGFTVNNDHYKRFCNLCDIKCEIFCKTLTEAKIISGADVIQVPRGVTSDTMERE